MKTLISEHCRRLNTNFEPKVIAMGEGSKGKHNADEMSIWRHLDELAKRLKVALYAVIISTIVFMTVPANLSELANPFAFYDPLVTLVLRYIRKQILPPDARLIGLGLTAPLELYFTASIIMGIGIALPIVAYEFYKFVEPGLYPEEKSGVFPFILSFIGLFVIGLLFGFFVTSPFLVRAMFPFFTAVGAETIISLMDFYTVVFSTTMITGAIFTTPVILVLLVRFGIISTTSLTKNRKYIYAGLLILVFIITADGGPVGDAILYIPLVTLLEIGIFFGKRYEKGRTVPKTAWLQGTTNCRYCKTEMSKDLNFCPKCGKAQV